MRIERSVHLKYTLNIFAAIIIFLSCVPIAASAESPDSPKSFRQEQSQSQISFENLICDLGEVGTGSKNACEFKFTNKGKSVLNITGIKNTCGCTVPELEKKQYAPGESGTIKATYIASHQAHIKHTRYYPMFFLMPLHG